MKLFFSGANPNRQYLIRAAQICPWRLMSCHTSYIRLIDIWMRAVIEQGNSDIELMLDSGAFTAWTKGDQVRLLSLSRAYRNVLRKYEKNCKAVWMINLDRIPGAKGREPSEKEITDAMHESDRNFIMLQKEFGDRVLPVFHQGEPSSRLNDVAGQADYICISPRNDLPERLRVQWSRMAHSKLRNRTHGLAATAVSMATSVAWHSTDSASWRMASIYGKVFFNLNRGPVPIGISKDSASRYDRGAHFDNMPAAQQQFLLKRIEAQGFTVAELHNIIEARCVFSMCEILEWNYSKNVQPLNAPSLFGM